MDRQLKESQMRRVAELYYEQNLSQQQIARIVGASHSTVSRLLNEARESGIVEIRIARRVETSPGVARQLRRCFDLRDVVVVPDAETAEGNLEAVGLAASELLLSVVANGMIVGITWGYTLHQMVRQLKPVKLRGVEVIQLSGSLGQGDSTVDGPRLAFSLAEHLGGTCRLLPAPAVVETPELKELLVNQKQIRATLTRAQEANVIVQGIGALADKESSLERAGYITEDERVAAIENGAVGHVFARMIDENGKEVGDYSSRVIGVPLTALRNADWSICVSASVQKAPAVLGALRARYFNTLVIDEPSANEVLRLAGFGDSEPTMIRSA